MYICNEHDMGVRACVKCSYHIDSTTMYCTYNIRYVPYIGKFSWDKIIVDAGHRHVIEQRKRLIFRFYFRGC